MSSTYPVKSDIRYVNSLVLHVQRSDNVRKLKKLFDGGKYGCDWVLGIVGRLLDNAFALKEIVIHQLTTVVM